MSECARCTLWDYGPTIDGKDLPVHRQCKRCGRIQKRERHLYNTYTPWVDFKPVQTPEFK